MGNSAGCDVTTCDVHSCGRNIQEQVQAVKDAAQSAVADPRESGRTAAERLKTCCDVYDAQACDGPVTSESLQDAIRDMEAEEVKRLCELGVDVNEPIDDEGHTMLDVLAREHLKNLEDALHQRYRLPAETVTKMFCEMQSNAFEVMKALQKNDAKMSSSMWAQAL
mmetsp:Transcript_50390/g.79904  ORF Transcript_50390/g.79904 Transcript_50390/m.79904 type:complete len:166 (-) Transcript_50390:153-650(-)